MSHLPSSQLPVYPFPRAHPSVFYPRVSSPPCLLSAVSHLLCVCSHLLCLLSPCLLSRLSQLSSVDSPTANYSYRNRPFRLTQSAGEATGHELPSPSLLSLRPLQPQLTRRPIMTPSIQHATCYYARLSPRESSTNHNAAGPRQTAAQPLTYWPENYRPPTAARWPLSPRAPGCPAEPATGPPE